MKRDCRCARARHDHGTEAGYTSDGCRCLPCALARQRYVKALREGDAPETRTTSITGTRRRLQALATLGWSPPELAARIGMNPEVVRRLRYPERNGKRYRDESTVLLATHDAVAALYDELWETKSQGVKANTMRGLARRRGWVPPLAWDDDEIDDPNATPHTPTGDSAPDLKPCGTAAAARRHHRRNEPLCAACRNAERRQRAERVA